MSAHNAEQPTTASGVTIRILSPMPTTTFTLEPYGLAFFTRMRPDKVLKEAATWAQAGAMGWLGKCSMPIRVVMVCVLGRSKVEDCG